MNPEPKFAVSADGTRLAYVHSGAGPAVILVDAALADRSGTAKLAQHLTGQFTVFNYDRRGRGQSGDTPPYAIEREVEDLAALIDAAGGAAFVFGSSSGAVLALEAASRLGSRVKKLFMYEPPFIVDASQPPMPADLSERVVALLAADQRSAAVKLFFQQGMGLPGFAVTLMSWLMPDWKGMVKVAHTIPYDLAVLAGTQTGRPLPAERWAATTAPVLVAVGGKSEPFFHTGAQALVARLPSAQYASLPGRDHGAILMAPQALAVALTPFFLG